MSRTQFATYFRDSETGLDYAQNRYHVPGQGRFMSPDPYMASGGPADPGSWNRYAYTRGDPVNRADPLGLQDQLCGNPCTVTGTAPTGPDPSSVGGPGHGGSGFEDFCHSDGVISNPYAYPECQNPQTAGIDLGIADVFEAPNYLQAASDRALEALKNCSDLFSTPASRAAGWDPEAVFMAVFGNPGTLLPTVSKVNGKYVSSSFAIPLAVGFNDALAYKAPYIGLSGAGIGIRVDLNASSFVFSGRLGNDFINAAVMLHELGHVLNFLFPGASKIEDDAIAKGGGISASNTLKVMQQCGLTQ